MSDLDTSVRRLLEDRAAAVSAPAGPPPALMRRARMRRLRTGSGAGLLALALLLGTSVALGRTGGGETTTDLATQPPTSVETTEPTAPVPTTAAVTPSTTLPAPARAVPPPTTRTTTRAPVYVEGVPQVKATPASAKPGTRVRIEGSGFTDEQWAAQNASLWLVLEGGGCSLYAEAAHSVRVSGGRLTGEFTVPNRGQCRQSDTGDEPVVAGRYRIAFSCTACIIGEFRVTASSSTRTACRTVGFTPNSDDAASSIVAHNMPCSEAEALVRKVAQPLGFNGPATAEADGFRCVRTGQDDQTLPMAFYKCTNGAKQVTFTRT